MVYKKTSKSKSCPPRRPYKISLARLPASMKPETKRKDVVIENNNSFILGNALGPITVCFHLEQGPGLEQRIGRKVNAMGINIKGHFYNKPGNPAVFVRMMVLSDKERNNQTFNGDQLFLKAGQSVSHDQGTESAYLSVNKARYRVFSDKLIKLSAANTNAENLKIFSTYIKLNGMPMKYTGNLFSDLATNNIQIIYFAINPSGSVVTTEKVTANYQVTAYYQDP